MAGNYFVMTERGQDISDECFVLRMQDCCAATTVEGYCVEVEELCRQMERHLDTPEATAADKTAAKNMRGHLAACMKVLERFNAFPPESQKLPD